ncbi:glycine zipper family protein [Formosa sp. PL04]|uniref:glycine zipper family protein n=1 Tax=Formosa sp. PL04 TaxID=3081755 RepID=UPI0029827107|nr:glycine zipper domain-containing protein [Formosa sp. PL04]MDW5288928.1 glycine zipper domain-containing protein [Formosa sp. PL04]
MKKIQITLFMLVAGAFMANAQSSQNSSIASGLGLYVFPAKGQDQATQNSDESACYSWAKEQTGYDPMNPTQYTAAPVDKSPDGSAIKGGALGAGAGAAIGAIAGDTGEGAAIGAVLGGLRGRRAKVQGEQKQEQQNAQAASSKSQAAATDYNNAFTACMEGKGYTVK